MQTSWTGRILGMAALSLAACSAQVDSDYRGESLGAVKVALEAGEGDSVPASSAVGLIWDLIDPEGYDQGTQFGELIDVTGNIPSEIELDLAGPPPEPLLVEMAERQRAGVGAHPVGRARRV